MYDSNQELKKYCINECESFFMKHDIDRNLWEVDDFIFDVDLTIVKFISNDKKLSMYLCVNYDIENNNTDTVAIKFTDTGFIKVESIEEMVINEE